MSTSRQSTLSYPGKEYAEKSTPERAPKKNENSSETSPAMMSTNPIPGPLADSGTRSQSVVPAGVFVSPCSSVAVPLADVLGAPPVKPVPSLEYQIRHCAVSAATS